MNRSGMFTSFFAWIACIGLVGCSAMRPQTDETDAAPRPQTTEEWVALSKPSGAHRLLEGFVGTWDIKITFWSTPDAIPQVSKGVSDSKWVLGGRFVQESFSGVAGGEKFDGIGLMGFDNGRRRVETVWIDSMNTALATAKGTFDPESQIFEFEGTVFDPLTSSDKVTKSTVKFLSPNHYVFTMYDHDRIKGDFKSLEMEYVRKAA